MKLRHLGVLFIAAVASYIGYNAWSLNSDVKLLEQKAEILNRELVQRQAENDQLKKELLDLQSDEYVEKLAREQLGLIRRGEIPYWTGPRPVSPGPDGVNQGFPTAPTAPAGQPVRVH